MIISPCEGLKLTGECNRTVLVAGMKRGIVGPYQKEGGGCQEQVSLGH